MCQRHVSDDMAKNSISYFYYQRPPLRFLGSYVPYSLIGIDPMNSIDIIIT